ncbi:hypothetical protein DL93DRAFT_1171020 [Clavulina sp. PMI_390]|nr:hypothetical protein DL93DRAFT_1171020 [Clavulina sp. PMI_390]
MPVSAATVLTFHLPMALVKATFTSPNKASQPHTSQVQTSSHSSVENSPIHTTGDDFFSSLPPEILFLIIDALEITSSRKPNHLHTLSVLNRHMNNLTNAFLWRGFFIGPRPSANLRLHVHERVDALLRDSQRVAHLRRLHVTLQLTFAGEALVLKIPKVFAIVPQLRKLDINISEMERNAFPLSSLLAQAMENMTYPMPFQLEQFECDARLFTSPPGIYKFLLAQPSIRRLGIRLFHLATPFWIVPHPTTLKARYGILGETSIALLPSIEEIYGPAPYVSLVLHGVQHSLKNVVLHTQTTVSDLYQARAFHRSTHDADDPVLYQPSPCCSEASYPSPASLIRSDSVSIWTHGPAVTNTSIRPCDMDEIETRPILPFLLTWVYGIAPSSLRSLRLQRSKPFSPVENDISQFPLAILRDLSSLEELRWWINGPGKPNVLRGTIDLPNITNVATRFLEGVMREATSDRLWMISFLALHNHHIELRYTHICDGILKEEQEEQEEQEGRGVIDLQLSDGSKWMMSFKSDSIAERTLLSFKTS